MSRGKKKAKTVKKKPAGDEHLAELEKRLSRRLMARVNIQSRKRGGSIEIRFSSPEELDRFLEVLLNDLDLVLAFLLLRLLDIFRRARCGYVLVQLSYQQMFISCLYGGGTLERFWKKSVDIIKEKVTRQNFDTWISPVRISSMDGPQVELCVPNRFFRDWLMDHYMDIIKESLSSVAGTPLAVKFVIDNSPVAEKKLLADPDPVITAKKQRQNRSDSQISPVSESQLQF